MRTTFIGHAAVLIEAQGLRILSDPWWEGPCFGTQWWVYPHPELAPLQNAPLDYVYISHGHHDHLHLGTLRRLPKGFTILVSDELDLAPFLRENGFTVIEIGRDQELDLGDGVSCRLIPTCNDDTLLAVRDHTGVCINLNDALHAASAAVQESIASRLRQFYPEITYLYCGYGIASHFPNCYLVPGADRIATAARRQAYFNRQWVKIVAALEPRYAFPFAADVVLLEEDLIWSNEPVHNSERPTGVFRQQFPDAATKVIDIAPGFAIDGDDIVREAVFEPLDLNILRQTFADEYAVANRISKIPGDGVANLAQLVRDNVGICGDYLAEFRGDYRALIRLRDSDRAIAIAKRERRVSVEVVEGKAALPRHYQIILTTRFAYLRRALTHPFGGEVLYVGSGCLIEYRDRAMVRRNLHRELLAVLRHRVQSPPSRYGDQSRLAYVVKQGIKRLMGRTDPDPYDLETWIVNES